MITARRPDAVLFDVVETLFGLQSVGDELTALGAGERVVDGLLALPP